MICIITLYYYYYYYHYYIMVVSICHYVAVFDYENYNSLQSNLGKLRIITSHIFFQRFSVDWGLEYHKNLAPEMMVRVHLQFWWKNAGKHTRDFWWNNDERNPAPVDLKTYLSCFVTWFQLLYLRCCRISPNTTVDGKKSCTTWDVKHLVSLWDKVPTSTGERRISSINGGYPEIWYCRDPSVGMGNQRNVLSRRCSMQWLKQRVAESAKHWLTRGFEA